MTLLQLGALAAIFTFLVGFIICPLYRFISRLRLRQKIVTFLRNQHAHSDEQCEKRYLCQIALELAKTPEQIYEAAKNCTHLERGDDGGFERIWFKAKTRR